MPAAVAGTRPVDLVHLATYTGGDTALNAEVLQLFVDQCGSLIRQLSTVLETHEQKTWREINHSLKGAARGIGAFALADAAADAEHLSLAQDEERARRALHALNNRAHAVQLFIEAYLGR